MHEMIEHLQQDIRQNQTILHVSIFNTILSVIVIILLLLPCKCPCCTRVVDGNVPNVTVPQFDTTLDPSIDWGERETPSPEEIQEALRQQVEEGMMNISMNTNPAFENGTAVGNVLITNSTSNRYAQVVEIYRDDTGELIYRSGVIPVGARIDNAKLMVNLPQGVYDCTAEFNQISDEGTLLGKACAKIQIYILN